MKTVRQECTTNANVGTYDSVNYTKQYLRYIGILIIAILCIVLLFGRMEFHNELERQVLPHTLIGYVNEAHYWDMVPVTAEEWPDWASQFHKPDEALISFVQDGPGGRIGIFADLVYYENRYEKRTWLTGRLLVQEAEYYYKPEGALYLEAVYEPDLVSEINLQELVPQEYDFMAFRGNK